MASFLERDGRRVAVVGGLGLLGHGVTRATVDLDRALPTSPEDGVALRRLRGGAVVSQAEYFRFLSRLPAPRPEDLRARRGPRGEPFRL